jgi:hypothetical protein
MGSSAKYKGGISEMSVSGLMGDNSYISRASDFSYSSSIPVLFSKLHPLLPHSMTSSAITFTADGAASSNTPSHLYSDGLISATYRRYIHAAWMVCMIASSQPTPPNPNQFLYGRCSSTQHIFIEGEKGKYDRTHNIGRSLSTLCSRR